MTLTCTRNCSIRNSHLTDCVADDCKGCLPRPAEEGLLCVSCYSKLRTLLSNKSNPESLAAVINWLSDNRGQHLTQTVGGGISGSGGVASYGERATVILSTSVEIQRSLRELLSDFAPESQSTSILMYLGLRLDALSNWEPIGDHMDHLEGLREDAHAVAPWREKKDDKVVRAAALLFLAPAETAAELATRFDIPESKVKRYGKLGLITHEGTKPKTYRPWDVYKQLCPENALEMEYRLVAHQSKLMHSTSYEETS